MAVEPQPRKIQIAALIQVHFHPVHDLLQLRPRDPERPDQGSERARHRMLRTAREEPRDLAAPPRQGRAPDRRLARLVPPVAHLPAERRQRRNPTPPTRRRLVDLARAGWNRLRYGAPPEAPAGAIWAAVTPGLAMSSCGRSMRLVRKTIATSCDKVASGRAEQIASEQATLRVSLSPYRC